MNIRLGNKSRRGCRVRRFIDILFQGYSCNIGLFRLQSCEITPIMLAILGVSIWTVTAFASLTTQSIPATSKSFLATLTEQERAWLRDHPVIRVFQDPTWPPIEFTAENGNHSGMTKDYVTLIEQRLDRKFVQVVYATWAEGYALLKRGELDMVTSVRETPERLDFLGFHQALHEHPHCHRHTAGDILHSQHA